MVFQKATTIKFALGYTFKKELFNKVFEYAHKRPVIYWMNYTKDRFIDNTKDRWRKDQDIQNKEDLLDEIADLKRFDYFVNEKFHNLGYIDTSDFLNRLKVKRFFMNLRKNSN